MQTAVERNPVISPMESPQTRDVAVLQKVGNFCIKPSLVEPLQSDEVLVEVEGCGVCASSLPVWEGREWFNYPVEAGKPGHEGWGTIVARGPHATSLPLGQRVTFLSDFAFAQKVNVPLNRVVPLPRELDGRPFPGEAIGCAMNIFRRADIQKGQNVAIIGAGFLGLLLVELVASAGARVFAFSRRESARALARELGAQETWGTKDWWGSAQRLLEQTGGKGCERVIEVTGMQFALDVATEVIAEYGKLIVGGYHQDGRRQVNMQVWNYRCLDVLNAHERDPQRYLRGIEEGISATIEGRIHPERLLTHRFPMKDLDRAFQTMKDRPDDFIKGWVEP